ELPDRTFCGETDGMGRLFLRRIEKDRAGLVLARSPTVEKQVWRKRKTALALKSRRNVRKIKSFTRFFSKNRGNGRGRAPSQALTCRTSEAEHSFAIDNEACAAPKKYSKKTFSTSSNAPIRKRMGAFAEAISIFLLLHRKYGAGGGPFR